MMTNCLKCTYAKGDTAEDRACKKCGRPKNVSKGNWPPSTRDLTAEDFSLASLIGEPAVPGPAAQAAMACDRAYREQPTQAAPAAGLGVVTIDVPVDPAQVTFTLADLIGEGAPPENPPPAPAQPAGAGSDGSASQAITSSAPAAASPAGTSNPQTASPFDREAELHPTDAGGCTQPVGVASPASSASSPSAPTALPEHSPKGGSGAKRWMNCRGSYGLIEALRQRGELVDHESEFAKRGTLIHAVAEQCLVRGVDVWEIQSEFPDFNPEDGLGTQQYVNYVRSLPGHKSYEQFYYLPQLHKHMYGKLDTVQYVINPGPDDVVLEVVDLKAGEGVYVDEVDNDQGKYYLALEIMSDPEFYDDAAKVRFTIAQPFVTWADQPIRSWDTTVGGIKRWVAEDLLPALNDDDSTDLVMGDWCQFCPAKLSCPAQKGTADALAAEAQFENVVETMTDEELGRRYVEFERIKTYGKALAVEAHRRLMDRKTVPGVKLVLAKADRMFKEKMTVGDIEWSLEAAAAGTFGKNAYAPPKLLSPAQMEKLPGGPTFVATWAYKPDAGYSVALESDRRRATVAKSGAELFANTLKHLDTSAA